MTVEKIIGPHGVLPGAHTRQPHRNHQARPKPEPRRRPMVAGRRRRTHLKRYPPAREMQKLARVAGGLACLGRRPIFPSCGVSYGAACFSSRSWLRDAD